MSTSKKAFTIGIVGARGHTGAELIKLIAAHPQLSLGFVSSRELAGQRVGDVYPDVVQRGRAPLYDADASAPLLFENLDADAVAAKGMDAVILALPNNLSAPFVTALDAARPDTVIVDLSADHRFEGSWYYGLPELTRGDYTGQKHISNPGCYATAMQLAISPLLDQLAGPPQCFGVSGYSGAGTSPSDKNNPELLRDNLMPYALTNHVHEREVTAHLRVPVEFMPHVAPHFRGITMTVNLWLQQPLAREQIVDAYRRFYANEPLDRDSRRSPVGKPYRRPPWRADRRLRRGPGRQARGGRGDPGQPAQGRGHPGHAEPQPGPGPGRTDLDSALIGARHGRPSLAEARRGGRREDPDLPGRR
jgi:N-acetyl-gamma-glutamyl-phosphate reductase